MARAQRVRRYRGYPPDVHNPYRGGYRPFEVAWTPTGGTEVLRYRIRLSTDMTVVIRYSEAIPAAPDTVIRSDTLSTEPAYPRPGLRVIAAYRIRGMIRYTYPYPDQTDRDWDAALRASVPRLLAATDSAQYALAVAELATHVHDSHVGVSGPGWSAAVDGSHVPVGVRFLGDTLVVTGFSTDSVRVATGLSPGDIIIGVDGESVEARLARLGRVFPASTPQALRRTAAMQILGVGPEGSTSRLSVRAEDGRQRIVTVGRTTERWWYAFATNRNLPIVTRVTPRIGYIDLSRLTRDQVDSAFAALADTRAIIFDMRGYPRGTAWSIAPRLVRGDSVPMARGWTRVVASPDPTRVKRVTRLEYVPTNIRLPRTGERP